MEDYLISLFFIAEMGYYPSKEAEKLDNFKNEDGKS